MQILSQKLHKLNEDLSLKTKKEHHRCLFLQNGTAQAQHDSPSTEGGVQVALSVHGELVTLDVVHATCCE